MFEPDVPDFACRHGNIDGSLDALNEFDQVFDLLFAAVDGFVADHDAVDVAVAFGEIDRRQHFAFVAVSVLVDPSPDGDLYSDFVGDRRYEFDAAGGRVKPDGACQRRQHLHIRANLFAVRDVVDVGVRCSFVRRVRHAWQNTLEVGGLFLVPQYP